MGKRTLSAGALLLAACSASFAGDDPGDQYSRSWSPPHEQTCESRVVTDCDGAELECDDYCRVRESCVTIRNCILTRPLRIYGRWSNLGQVTDSDWTRTPEYVAEMRAQAPHSVRIESSSVLVDDGRTPVYVGPGVTFLTIDDVTIEGQSRSVMLYIGAEASRIRIARSRIDGSRASRGAIAIDAADYVSVVDTELWGAVELYRNCGEDWLTRQTTPSNARFERVTSDGPLHISARDGGKAYCVLDDVLGDVGSAASNLDHARWTTVDACEFSGGIHEGDSAKWTIVQ